MCYQCSSRLASTTNHDFDALSSHELDEAFAAGVKARDGAPYDLIGFDACLMGSLETAYLLHDDAQWMVASEEIETGAGWDYQALLDALGSGADARDAGVALCDSYMAKSAERHKDASVTLSVIDLSKVERVVEGIASAISETETAKHGDAVAVLRAFAYGSRQAESFGGASEDEGHTNLVDLSGLADAAVSLSSSGTAWTELQKALEQAISYNVCGKATSGAKGLSLWYPVKSTNEEIDDYAADSPLADYASAISNLFNTELGEVAFLDFGPLAADGGLTATIDPKSADAFFDIYVRNWSADGVYADTNVDLFDDWEKLSFTYYPGQAVGITLDGMVLDANVVDYGDGYQVFLSPVKVNGKSTNLRTCWFADKSESGGGHYELLGTWDGIDDASGLSDRSLGELQAGDAVEAISSETGEVRERIVVKGTPEVSETPLPPGRYECQFVALDLLGNGYLSDEQCEGISGGRVGDHRPPT